MNILERILGLGGPAQSAPLAQTPLTEVGAKTGQTPEALDYAQNWQSPRFLGVDPAKFGYAPDNGPNNLFEDGSGLFEGQSFNVPGSQSTQEMKPDFLRKFGVADIFRS